MMKALPLQLRDGHLFVELCGDLWLLGTGAPTSFGTSRSLTIAGEPFSPDTSYLGLTAVARTVPQRRRLASRRGK